MKDKIKLIPRAIKQDGYYCIHGHGDGINQDGWTDRVVDDWPNV